MRRYNGQHLISVANSANIDLVSVMPAIKQLLWGVSPQSGHSIQLVSWIPCIALGVFTLLPATTMLLTSKVATKFWKIPELNGGFLGLWTTNFSQAPHYMVHEQKSKFGAIFTGVNIASCPHFLAPVGMPR